jgi:cation diffusion facilitator family transporter
MEHLSKRRVMALSLGAAVGTLGLKFLAYWITGSAAILSDAAESFINVTAAAIAFLALEIAARPADASHAYGHEKAEYFSSGFEGSLILAASVGISYQAWVRLWNPIALEKLPLGLGIAVVAALINLAVALALLATARRSGSITLEAHARHLLTDVWTTAGVVAGLGVGMLVQWPWLDSAIAFAVAISILISGLGLLRRSFQGLMDYALPPEEIDIIHRILDRYRAEGVLYHRLRTRRAGTKRFVDFHLLVPGQRSVQETHDLCEIIESEMARAMGEASITIHIEPLEDPASWEREAAPVDPSKR